MSEPTVQWDIFVPHAVAPPAPRPDEEWLFPYGRAWVYYATGHTHLVNPVIFSDGFESGPSRLDLSWDHMERRGEGFITALRNQGNDLILLGYDERSASILDNAEVAIQCVLRASAESTGMELVVGGFGMGGLVTRYALAKMESEAIDHRTALYFSWDSPHRGAWIPIGLQALAHHLRDDEPAMSARINSPAARQLLWRHIEEVGGEASRDPLRTGFLSALADVGEWPRRPLKLGLANGSGDGIDLGVPAGTEALKVHGGTTLYTQASGDGALVARLPPATLVHTSGLPELDGAPGGTLEIFGIARDELAAPGAAESEHRMICFVPSVSAVAIRDLDSEDDVYADIGGLSPDESELDEFVCASENQAHSRVTRELGGWLLDRLPR
jgi:hypothetical protein